MSIKSRYLATAAIGALLAVGASGTAQATPAYAYAEIQFTNFDLNLQQVQVTGSTVQGTTATNMSGYNPTSTTTTGNLVTGVASPPAYSGPLGNNFAASGLVAGNFGPQLATSAGAQAQQLISGAISGANSYQVSEAHLTSGPATAGALTNSNTAITIDIAALAGQKITLNATAMTTLAASFGMPGDIANASSSASFAIKNAAGTTVFSDANPLLNNPDAALQALFANTPVSYASGPVTIADSYTFAAAGNYAITLYDNTSANVATVPEPLSVALLGSGLALLGVVRLRRQA